MGLFDQFPYTNFHELNLDWILKALKELEHTIEQFVAINALKYADPIQWNITSQYEKNTIVIDPQTGTAFISVQPVPSGVALTNEDYWTVVFDLGQFVVRASKNFANTYEAETTLTATVSTAAGGWLIWGDTLYKALVNITAGDSYVIGGNIAHFTMEDVIGHLEDLTTTDKSNVVAAINEVAAQVLGKIGDLEDLSTTDKSNLVAAINEVVDNLAAEAQARESADGDLDDLNTTDKSNLVAAINEVDDKVDNVVDLISTKFDGSYTSQYAFNSSDFITEFNNNVIANLNAGNYIYSIVANNHRVTAIVNKNSANNVSILISSYSTATNGGHISVWNYNQLGGWVYNPYATEEYVRDQISSSTSGILADFYSNKKILIIGDSLATTSRVWVQRFTDYVTALGATVTVYATSGFTTQQVLEDLQSKTGSDFDLCILWSGTNDWNSHVMPGNTFGLVSGTYGYYLDEICKELINNWGNPELLMLSVPFSVRPNVVGKLLGRREWNRMCFAIAKRYGATYLDILKAPLIGTSQDPAVWMDTTDYNHFNSEYQDKYLWQFITKGFATKNDGLVGVDTVYTVNNVQTPMFTAETGVSLYRQHLTVNDNGFANLQFILNTTAALTPNNNTIKLGTWNADIYSNEDCPIEIVDSNGRKYYGGVLVHGNSGEARIYTDETIATNHTLYVMATNFRTNLTQYYAPSNL